MISKEESVTIQIMYKQGYSKKRIARELGISINTVRKYLNSGSEPSYSKRPLAPMKLDPYRAHIVKRLNNAHPKWIPATVIYREIVDQGYTGKISILREYMRQLKPSIKVVPVVRFETKPGEQMQVDWAEFRKGKDRLSAFVATLGYSRMAYVEFVTDEKLETLLRCHENAFEYFAGVPMTCLYDNMRTIITQRNAYGPGEHRLQAGFWDFSKHYGFLPRVCKPYRAQTKGKVERFIHYLKHSFYYPLQAELKPLGLIVDKELANYKVLSWLNTIANKRLHATTNAIPVERLIEEQPHMQPIPARYKGCIPQGITTGAFPSSTLLDRKPLPSGILQHDLKIYEQFIEARGVIL